MNTTKSDKYTETCVKEKVRTQGEQRKIKLDQNRETTRKRRK